jgi:hypothetical protein
MSNNEEPTARVGESLDRGVYAALNNLSVLRLWDRELSMSGDDNEGFDQFRVAEIREIEADSADNEAEAIFQCEMSDLIAPKDQGAVNSPRMATIFGQPRLSPQFCLGQGRER